MKPFHTETWTIGEADQDIQLSVRYLGSVFFIQYSPGNIKDPALLEWYGKLFHALNNGDGTAASQLRGPFESLMESSAPNDQGYSVSDYLYPQYFLLEATAREGDTEIRPRHPIRLEANGNDVSLPGAYIGQARSAALSGWDIYSSRQIRLLPSSVSKDDPRLLGPEKVSVADKDDKVYFFKRFGGFRGATFRELDTYERIRQALAPSLRICRLHGLVVDSDETSAPSSTRPGQRLVGLLLTFIETNAPTWMGTLSSRLRRGDCSAETRSRWVGELEEWADAFDEASIVWGDVKRENILVDKEDNIWAIDFGGGYTRGCVDKALCETREGDRQGVDRIKSFLLDGEKDDEELGEIRSTSTLV